MGHMESKAARIIMTILFGTALSSILGMIPFGMRILDPGHPAFQFISFGLIGSSAFALFLVRQYRDAIFVTVLLFILNFFFSGRTVPGIILTYLLFFVAVTGSVYLYSRYFYDVLSDLLVARPLILSSMMAISFVVATFLLFLVFGSVNNQFYPLGNLPIGFLIGLGLGVAFEFVELLAGKTYQSAEIQEQ
ncbi:MAG: hypothetical protein AB7W47_16320 [Calditrichaceae bacterium]